jgi:hypothetical protein
MSEQILQLPKVHRQVVGLMGKDGREIHVLQRARKEVDKV